MHVVVGEFLAAGAPIEAHCRVRMMKGLGYQGLSMKLRVHLDQPCSYVAAVEIYWNSVTG
jgi:hypothetical protein